MTYEINTAYKVITQHSENEYDTYVINPFDLNGFLIPQINIDLRLELFNGYPILFFIPPVNSFNGQYNFKIDLTVYSNQGQPFPPAPLAYAGNMTDYYTSGTFFGGQGGIFTPIGLLGETNLSLGNNPESGFYNITPYYLPFAQPFMAMNQAEALPPTTFRELFALAQGQGN